MSSIATTPIFTEEDTQCKFNLCVLLTQFGKTFTAIDRITTEINQDSEFGKSFHIVFTMNTLLNNGQFAKRLETINELYGTGSVCVLSSKYNGTYTHAKTEMELRGLCMDEETCPRVVVMCSNTIRYTDGITFLRLLNKNNTCIRRAFAYYDELHQYINDSLRSQIEEINSLDIVHGIIALSASPDKIWKKSGFWSNIRLLRLAHFNDSGYAGCGDMVFNCDDGFFNSPYVRPGPRECAQLDRETTGYITHILDRNPDILCADSRTFIPAHKRRVGHYLVRDIVFSKSPEAIVVILNGERKVLEYLENGAIKTIPLSYNFTKKNPNPHPEDDNSEVCETISKVIAANHFEHRPLVITGLLCVGMGQTLTHESFGSFTGAIFGHMDLTNDEIYQLFGRITGRMKLWKTYCRTQVYCPTIIMNRCVSMEECARNMAIEHNGDLVTLDDYREPMMKNIDVDGVVENIRPVKEKKVSVKGKPSTDEFEYMCEPTLFNSFEKAKEFLRSKEQSMCSKVSGSKSSVIHIIDGYSITSKLVGSAGVAGLTANDRLTLEKASTITASRNISSTEKGSRYLILPVYDNMESPPNSVKFQVRYIHFKQAAVQIQEPVQEKDQTQETA